MNVLEANPRIRKYMDLARFVSLLTTRSLYFACPSQFNDTYEGLLPKSHLRAEAAMLDELTRPVRTLRDQMLAGGVPPATEEAVSKLDEALGRMGRSTHREVNAKFGISCWHESDYE